MQRMAVAKLVNNHPNLTMVAEYSNAIEAKNGIKNHEIDLIFLDVEMPIITVFALINIDRTTVFTMMKTRPVSDQCFFSKFF